jgi:peroxiredoxin
LTIAVIVLLVVLTLLLLAALFLFVQLTMQSGRILLRLEALEHGMPWSDQRLGVQEYVPTLPKGVPAPPIALPDLNGTLRHLSEWRGSRVLLVFFDPNNIFSRRLLPALVAISSDVVPGRPVPIVISTGDADANRRVFSEAGLTTPVLLQEATEVAGAYKVDGTPMAYLIDVDGTIAADIAVGIQQTLILAGEMAAVSDATMTYRGGAPRREPLETNARIRDGLREGDNAPLFRLPQLDGSELSLLDYRGQNVLVVFSDPDCGPCDELGPLLQSEHEAHPELTMLMISRGDIDATAAMIDRFGFTFPVALQNHWEISREYGIFAVPVAFEIDEWGTIAAGVAIGPEGIIALIRHIAGNASAWHE